MKVTGKTISSMARADFIELSIVIREKEQTLMIRVKWALIGLSILDTSKMEKNTVKEKWSSVTLIDS